MSKRKTKSTKLNCHAPDAEVVFLAGTFNDWQMDATPMTTDGKGNWNSELNLPPGRCEYKFVVDGQWCCEPNCQTSAECPKCVPNEFGTMNRFVDVV